MQPRRKRLLVDFVVDRFKERFAPAVGYWEDHWDSLETKIRLCMMRQRKGAADAGKVVLNERMDRSASKKRVREDEDEPASSPEHSSSRRRLLTDDAVEEQDDEDQGEPVEEQELQDNQELEVDSQSEEEDAEEADA